MGEALSPIADLRARYARGEADPVAVVDAALARANSNAGRNVYLARNEAWTREQARSLRREDLERQALWGVPVSLKDCFELEGFPTSCGSRFYLERNGVAVADSEVAKRLRAAGAVIVGKTHLHQVAYGITGENRDFGDCVQPREATWLTGGSSSGAAASVQEGSALAGIGTDTGGSIRVPAALCGLAGYRGSVTLGDGLWEGATHLAETFDTLGWLFEDLRDGPVLAEALFGVPAAGAVSVGGLRVGFPDDGFLRDAEPAVVEAMRARLAWLEDAGASVERFDAGFWEDALGIVGPIQAAEAAVIHAGNFEALEPVIAERLRWGAALSVEEIAEFRVKRAEFCARMEGLFTRFDYLLTPCCPMEAMLAGVDHAATRGRVLRYTAPMSLAGLPVLTLPDARGLQFVGRLGGDAELVGVGALLGKIA